MSRFGARLRAIPHLDTYASLGVIVVGIALIVFAWAKVAGLENVALQVPYLISAGCSGLALVVLGAIGVNLSAKRADAAARREQLVELRALLEQLGGNQ